jgi:hypothetical protein
MTEKLVFHRTELIVPGGENTENQLMCYGFLIQTGRNRNLGGILPALLILAQDRQIQAMNIASYKRHC